MRVIIELEKNDKEVCWNASLEVDGQGYCGVAATPEEALESLLNFTEVQEVVAKA